MARRMQKGLFDLNDLSDQLKQMQNMGGMGGIMGMMPGVGKIKKQIDAAGLDESVFKRQQAIISSMTKKERTVPKLLNASRKKRVAAGSGTSVQEINKLLKMHRGMGDMMRKMGKRGGLGALMGGMGGGMGNLLSGGVGASMGAGMPDISKMDSRQLEEMARQMGGPGGNLPNLPGMGGKNEYRFRSGNPGRKIDTLSPINR